MALCEGELKNNYSATSVYEVGVRRYHELPFVYGDADFSDATKVHFRCKVFQDKVESIHFLVQHPMDDNARLWSTERPHGDQHVDLPLDDKAMAPPQYIEGSPVFERVPQ